MKENKAQKQAIWHKDGPMMVLAGPGSGKTTVITNRIKMLIEEYGVKPERILVITFTKAAAVEMKERFLRLLQKEDAENAEEDMGRSGANPGVNFGTFHAVYFKILKYAYNYDASCIIKEEDRYQFFRDLIRKLGLEIEDEKEFIEGIGSEISLVKGERINIEHYFSMNCSEENFKKIYQAYENMLRSTNRIDFDDMLLLCYELLTQRSDILKFWQQRYEYILIDEFQDINKVQYDIIRLLALPQNNLFIVGDDDQSIYRFRGAKPEIMLNFETDYPGCKRVLLDINYRSTGRIVKAAGQLIAANTKRFPKNIRTEQEDGKPVQIKEYQNVKAESEAIVRELLDIHLAGEAYKNTAILYRTNTQPSGLVAKLMEYNIPFRMKDSLPNIFEHWIAKNLTAYIRLAQGSRERALFLQIMNRPKRYLSRDAFQTPEVDLQQVRQYYWKSGKEYVLERLNNLEYNLKLLGKMTPYAAVSYIRRAIGYDEYLKEYANFRRINVEELYDTLAQLQDSAKEFRTYKEWFAYMEEYKQELQKQNEQRGEKDKDAIAMMTFHGAKGLEFERVYIIDANEGITPHRKAAANEDMEEERRMFYVAVTRAKKNLIITYTKERYNKKQELSRFIPELLTDRDCFKEGCIVRHRVYGAGKIVQNQDGVISIQFKAGIKKLNLEYCIQNKMLLTD